MEPTGALKERRCEDSPDGNPATDMQKENTSENPSGRKPSLMSEKERASGQQTSQSDEDGEAERNPDFVKEYCNQECLKQLLEVGISRLRAEKALFKTRTDRGGGTLDAALEWLEKHDQDADIDEPVSQEERPQPKAVLSPEEAQRKAYELQKKIREERAEWEKKEALDRERLRMAQTKAMLEQNAKLEEEQRKRQLALLEKEKEDRRKERERQRELMRQEYRERFGREMPEEDSSEEAQAARLQKMSGKMKVAYWCNYMNQKYKKDQKDALRTCLTTLRTYCANVKNHPLEAKYRKIRKQNNAFQSKVMVIEGAVQLLEACNFHDSGDFLEIRGPPDGFLLAEALKFIDVILQQLQ